MPMGDSLHFVEMIISPYEGYLFYSHDTTIFENPKQNQDKNPTFASFINKKSTSIPCSTTSYKINKNHISKSSNSTKTHLLSHTFINNFFTFFEANKNYQRKYHYYNHSIQFTISYKSSTKSTNIILSPGNNSTKNRLITEQSFYIKNISPLTTPNLPSRINSISYPTNLSKTYFKSILGTNLKVV